MWSLKKVCRIGLEISDVESSDNERKALHYREGLLLLILVIGRRETMY